MLRLFLRQPAPWKVELSGWPTRVVLALLAAVASCRGGESAAPRPDGPLEDLSGRIVFVSDRTGQPELFAMRPDGTEVVQLTDGSLPGVDDPAVSPDGRTVAFTALPPGSARIDVFLMNADGSGLRQLTPGVADEAPSWSPDGSRLAVHRFTDHAYDPFTLNADGSGQVLVSDEVWNEADPTWSPDGARLVFEADGTGDAEIYTVDAEGTGRPHRVTHTPGDDLFPAWSPDGRSIAYVTEEPGAGRDIATIDADGADRRILAGHPAADGDPAWSPDGERIAFESNRRDGSATDIFVMFADGTGVLRLTHDPADDEDPVWVP
jgi:Tol biopolymer transport system component